MEEKKKIFFSSRPKDTSLEAYKEWITGMVIALTGEARDNMSPEEWEKDWREFYEGLETKKPEK